VVVLVATTGSAAAPAARWRTHTIESVGSLALPSSWRDMTRQTPALRTAIQRASARNPRVEPLLYALTVQMGALVKFVAADFARASLKGGFVTNLSVLAQRSTVRFDAWAKANTRALQRTQSVIKPVSRAYVRLPAGRALRLKFIQRVQAGDHIATASVTQYAVARHGFIYLLTFSTTRNHARSYAPAFLRAARSLRIR
jgi:hypothetical protein